MTFLDDAIERWAAEAPDATAFRFGPQSLTYGQLSRQTNRLARWLAAAGVGRGDRVGIYLHKSIETAVAVFGILKAGAAYVPLDPGAPVSRLRGIVEDCAIRVVLSHRQKAEAGAQLTAAPSPVTATLGLDGADWGDLDGLDDGPVGRGGRSADDLAYVIFTSGSTGLPKGIQHTHASGLSYARMAADLYGLTPDDRLGGHSPLHFDMSTFDYFSAMLAGAATVIVPEPFGRLPASLSQLVETERLTVWYSAPYAIVLLVEKGVLDSRDISALRWVVFGGEPMSPKHLEALRAHAPAVRFSNSYGPAEVNQCTVYHLPAGPVPDTPVPLGHPCPHTRALIVDADGAAADEGELLIATPAMMRGYWGRPDLDARGFHDDEAGTRWYRTGDVVRRDADGLMHFLGRRDRQVKVRGHRVELDEVEHALAGCPGVSEAAALLRPGDAATVEGFVTLADGDPPAPDDVRRFAAGRLPAYAVPATVTVLSGFPRTGSGKIDRPALAAAQFGRQDP